MSKKLNSINLTAIKKVAEGEKKGIFWQANDVVDFIDGKPTTTFSQTKVEFITEELGVVTALFPFRKGLAEELNTQLTFGECFDLSDIGTFIDARITLYQNSLNIKFLMEED